MEIRDILRKVKDGEMDVDEALSVIERESEATREVKIKKLSKDDIRKIVGEKSQEKNSNYEEAELPDNITSLELHLKNGVYEINDGDTLNIEGYCSKTYDSKTNALVLRSSRACEVTIPEKVRKLKIVAKTSSVELDIGNRDYVMVQVDKSNVEGDIETKIFGISNLLGTVELDIDGAKSGIVENKLGNVELELSGKYNFDVSNSLGGVEIDEKLKDNTGGTIRIKNYLGNVEIS